MNVAYFDTSALVKLAVAEPETRALRDWIAQETLRPASSALAGVELRRAARRHGQSALATAADVMSGINVIAIRPEILDGAAALDPPTLRTLDAIHLATALRIGSSLAAFVAYDQRLAEAAQAAGLPVVAPA